MRAEQSVSAPRRSQLAISAAFRGLCGRSPLAEDARRATMTSQPLDIRGMSANLRVSSP
jgi:hypothetical protein